MTAVLSWHVQNFVVIDALETELPLSEIAVRFKFGMKIYREMPPCISEAIFFTKYTANAEEQEAGIKNTIPVG